MRQVCGGRVLGASSRGLILSSSIVLVLGCASSSWVCIVLFLGDCAVLSSWNLNGNLTLVLMRAGWSVHAGQGVQGNIWSMSRG